MLYEFNKTEAVSPKAFTLHGLFERQAAVTPERLSYMLKDSGASLLLTQPKCSVPNFSGETLEVDMTSLEREEAIRSSNDQSIV
ncbi:Long-chain-fatty-acid--CoA ligase [Bacillus subtilis]|nr:Long-chain-fatty-acid--CoA ligase [Bacillus subtilis]